MFSRCNPFSAELFGTNSKSRMVPLLCYNTSSPSSAQSKDSTQEYCKQVWENCKNVTIVNSPFQPPLQEKAKLPSSPSKITDVWQTEKELCTSFGGSSDEQSHVSVEIQCHLALQNRCHHLKGLGPDDEEGAKPCQYQIVVSEYSAKISSSSVLMATSAAPYEVRRIFTMGMPYTGRYGGQILFGPTDGYLYIMIPDGGSKGDPFNFSQNKKSLMGKIVRLDIDGAQSKQSGYLFTDLYSSSMWTGIETPEGSGNYTSSVIPMSCSKNSPIACDSTAEPSFGYIFTFGDDNSKDIYI
ncbi:hypothetical protein PR202_ga13075 [Eleusine coracana subsp. coracana]|uniref:Glucose/Sorbosone dehydrogenase domain-containing protein n=1 Tax=Eleusine coracana subsp. coracana TaxID=191504 RepID=A0AAV5CDV9_ELECO|nr:hypothetical protein PR202_ga13075 [Eleusine coracana subsp. coracana]